MDQNVTNATTLLGTFLNLKRLRRRKAFMKIKPKKVKNETYQNILLSIKDEESIKQTLNSYWTNFWEEFENSRFSPVFPNYRGSFFFITTTVVYKLPQHYRSRSKTTAVVLR